MVIFLRVIYSLAVMYALIVLYFIFFQKRMVYIAHRDHVGSPTDIPLPFSQVTITTEDNVNLDCWWVGEPDSGERDVLLYCHGNAGNISHRLDTFEVFNRIGCNTFIFDYRGYGRSGGSPSEPGTYKDAEAAWKYLTQKLKIPPERIIIFGRSLGGAVAIKLASTVKAKALIVEGTFSSITDVGALWYPWLPVRLFSRFHYDSIKRLPKIKSPLLVIHSPEDEVIPYPLGRKLFEAAKEPKEFMKIQGSHNTGFIDSGKLYRKGIRKFLGYKMAPKKKEQDETAGESQE